MIDLLKKRKGPRDGDRENRGGDELLYMYHFSLINVIIMKYKNVLTQIKTLKDWHDSQISTTDYT